MSLLDYMVWQAKHSLDKQAGRKYFRNLRVSRLEWTSKEEKIRKQAEWKVDAAKL